MNKKQLTGIVIAALIALAALISVSWAQGGPGNRQGQGRGQGGNCLLAFDGPMDDIAMVEEKLAIAIDDEYHAKAVYAAVLDQFGNVRPFSQIINAEQRHIDALTKLYEKYGLDVPEDAYVDAAFEFADLKAAAQSALDAEIANAMLYDELLANVSDPDVITVFENLQWASQERHLPAFERYLENDGQGRGRGQGNGQGRGRKGRSGDQRGCRR